MSINKEDNTRYEKLTSLQDFVSNLCFSKEMEEADKEKELREATKLSRERQFSKTITVVVYDTHLERTFPAKTKPPSLNNTNQKKEQHCNYCNNVITYETEMYKTNAMDEDFPFIYCNSNCHNSFLNDNQ